MGRRAGLLLGVVVLGLSGCGLAAGESTADYGPVGSAVTTSTSTTAPERALPTTTVMTLPPELMAVPEAATGPTTTAPAPPFCFSAETFVFETTQMLLQDTLDQALERADAGITALDQVVAAAPADIAGLAAGVRAALAAVVADPASTSSLQAFETAALAMVQREAGTIDSLFSTATERCEVNVTDPNRPSLEGANNIAGA
jgi:hypothetical protein